MARSPFQGTYQAGVRPTVVMAPDALVYINGETDILGCHRCRRRFDWNRYITSIQVDLNVDSAPGSASINLSVPRHSVDEFYFDGTPLITPMMEVEIYAKGYFLVEGIPQYYPIFWGLVNEISDSYSGGEHTFSINCSDILKWWELCKMNINPAFTQTLGSLGRNIFGNVFFGTNPYDVIWTLAQQSFGDVVVGSGSLVSLYKENQQKKTFNAALGDIMQYWSERFGQIRSNLLLYGTSGNAVRGDLLYAQYQSAKPNEPKHFASQAVRQANGGTSGSQMGFDPTDPGVVAFRTQFQQAGQINFWQSEYQTKLEVATAAKESIGYEFYMDVTGDIVFKPPFYNLDILSNKPVSWIQDIDVISWDFSESEAEVVTQIQLQGSFAGAVDYGMPEEATPYTSVTDYHLLRKYGWRSQTYNSEFMRDPMLMFYTGLDLLDRMNSKRHRGTVNIPFRPELRLGFPIYLAPKDQIWYIQGISHNIQMGGQATTTLTLTAKRQKFLAPRGIGNIKLTGFKGDRGEKKDTQYSDQNLSSRQLAKGGRFKADVGEAAQLPATNAPTTPGASNPYEPLILRHPKTGRLVGYPNVVLAYTRPFTPTDEELKKVTGRRTSSKRAVPNKFDEINKAAPKILSDLTKSYLTYTKEDELREKHLGNRYTYGLNSAGVYTYLHDQSKVVKEMLLLPADNVDFGAAQASSGFQGKTGMIRPVSDERGFELIGHYKYGRGVSLRDGSLVVSKDPNSSNSRATIGVPLTLSGGLYETLQAQSQGLTAVSTPYTNPADALVRLQPEDMQTAATINPKTKEPEYSSTETTFVDVAPLGSPEQTGGFPSVEASQLSRALTLAEMGLKEAEPDPGCDCLLGRGDLAFISVGYRVDFLQPTAEDVTSISYGAVSGAELAAIRAAVEEGTQLAAEDPLPLDPNDTGASSRNTDDLIQKFLADKKLSQGQVSSGLIAEALEDGKPVAGSALLRGSALSNQVDLFLAGLYQALDIPHQAHEAELRGKTSARSTSAQEVDPLQVRFGAPEDMRGIKPPFSSPQRALGGDPEALAQQGSSALEGLANTWNKFGEKLQANSERARLNAEKNRLSTSIAELRAEQERLEEARASGATIVSLDGSLDSRLQQIEQDLAKTRQELQNTESELNDLNQKFPP